VDVKTLAVVGAGQMGAGIAQVAAQNGIDVVLIDMNPELVQKGLSGIRAQLDKAVSKGKLKAEDAQAAVARLKPGASGSDAARAAKMGKTTVLSRDMPGFIVNRILIPMLNEACFALQEGLASAEDIDTAMKLGTNVPMGPLALADFIGLDTCLSIADVLHKGLGDDKYRPAPL